VNSPKILLVGAGSMGGAMLKSWIAQRAISKQSIILDPNLSHEIKAGALDFGLSIYERAEDVPSQEDIQFVIFAVKPQIAPHVLSSFQRFTKNAVYVSIMAGLSITNISRHLGGADKIVRIMPNLPASIGQGMSGAFATDDVSELERNHLEALLQVAGETLWVPTEQAIDFVTAVSGSGPAYFFLLTEALAAAGVELGLSPQNAEILARQTAIGAGALMQKDQRSASQLRIAVTSPGGTTDAALQVLDKPEGGFREQLKLAVKQAANRAQELSK